MTERSTKKKPDAMTASKAGAELDNFVNAFKDEKDLTEHIATLLRNMGRQEVRITHGSRERGKDIIFYGPSGMGDKSLYACVIKKGRINANVTSNLCAQDVLREAEQALRVSHLNSSNGRLERVKTVYIMSPAEPTADAIATIAEHLVAIGNVEFVCGSRLLDLFGEYYKSFVLFESNIMVSYLSAVRSNLQEDKALIELVLKRSILANSPAEFESMYVAQEFGVQMHHVTINRPQHSLPVDFAPTDDHEFADITTKLNYILRLANYLLAGGRLSADSTDSIESIQSAFSKLLDEYEKRKQTRERERSPDSSQGAFSKPLDEYEKRKQIFGRERFPDSSAKETKRKIDLKEMGHRLAPLTNRLEDIRKIIIPLLDADCTTANKSFRATGPLHTTVARKEFIAFWRLYDLEQSVPGTLIFDPSKLLREICTDASYFDKIPILLLIAPAGFGKTSFCKWQALNSAAKLLADQGNTLPIYVPLSRFASSLPKSRDEAFFESYELKQLLADRTQQTRIQLLLDGLDEIPDERRQHAVIDLARSVLSEIPNCQVIVTARDHIKGAWLTGIPRLHVKPLNVIQQRQLVQNWLGSREATNVFFEQLPRPLVPLMGPPLLATLTAAVYKKNQYLPATRTALYSLFVELLCGGWDAVKGTNRGSRFGMHDKRLVLTRLAGINHLNRERDASIHTFNTAVKETLSGFLERSGDLLEETLRDGLIIPAGTNLRFSHLSFQEFLAAEDLRGEPDNARARRMLESFFRGDDWWTEVLIFYVTSTLNPADMESWLIARATASTIGADLDRLDERLKVLRMALRVAFPEFRPQYPEDSGWQGWLKHN